jgi:hypothetical protein
MAPRTIPRRPKEDLPPWQPEFTIDDQGFVVESKWWTPIDTYPALDARIRGVKVYRTMHDEYIPLQYSIVSMLRTDNKYAWPLEVAILDLREQRFNIGDAYRLRFGIRRDEQSKVHDWRSSIDFPSFNNAEHGHLGSPDFVLMSASWVPVVRHQARPAPRR